MIEHLQDEFYQLKNKQAEYAKFILTSDGKWRGRAGKLKMLHNLFQST